MQPSKQDLDLWTVGAPEAHIPVRSNVKREEQKMRKKWKLKSGLGNRLGLQTQLGSSQALRFFVCSEHTQGT